MRPVSTWTVADLEALIGQDESASLEFNDARSLLNTDEKKQEIAKDVSAMANAAGGLIVYGVGEDSTGVATALAPIEARRGLAEWLDQVIANNIEPRVQGVLIHPIKLAGDKLAVVVQVPKATSLAPHQSTRHSQYFRRWNRTVQAMLDHEIRDLMRRSSAPELILSWKFEHWGGDEFGMTGTLANLASEPALYTYAEVTLDHDLRLNPEPRWNGREETLNDQQAFAYFRVFNVPASLPIMREMSEEVFFQRVLIKSDKLYHARVKLACPGFAFEENYEILRVNQRDAVMRMSSRMR